MRITAALLVAFTALAAFALDPGEARAQSAVALTGQVTFAEEDAMEGVVVMPSVTARPSRSASSPTPRVVSRSRPPGSSPASTPCAAAPPASSFAAHRRGGVGGRPGRQGRAQDPQGRESRRIRPMPSGCTACPAPSQQKKFLLNCIGCHTLERIVKSINDADASSTPSPGWGRTIRAPRRCARSCSPTISSASATAAMCKPIMEWPEKINLSQQDTWQFPLKTLPRPTGKSTNVIFTEFDLPQAHIQPDDVIMDARATSGTPTSARCSLARWTRDRQGDAVSDPGGQARLAARLARSRDRPGRQPLGWHDVSGRDREVRPEDRDLHYVVDPEVMGLRGGQFGHLAVNGTHVDGKVWVKNSDDYQDRPVRPRQREIRGPWRADRSTHRPAHRHLRLPRRHRDQRRLSARLLRRQHRQDRRQDQEGDRLPDAAAELYTAPRPRRRRRPPVVRRIPRRPHRHALSEDGAHQGVEGAVGRKLRRIPTAVRLPRRRLRPGPGSDAQRPRASRLDVKTGQYIEHTNAASDQYPPRLRRRAQQARRLWCLCSSACGSIVKVEPDPR